MIPTNSNRIDKEMRYKLLVCNCRRETNIEREL